MLIVSFTEESKVTLNEHRRPASNRGLRDFGRDRRTRKGTSTGTRPTRAGFGDRPELRAKASTRFARCRTPQR